VEILKQDLLISLQAVKALQEDSEVWRWHDKRIRYLLDLLYGDKTTDRLPQDGGESLHNATDRRTDR